MQAIVGNMAGRVPLSVVYHGSPITDGAELTKAQAAHAPRVTFEGASAKLTTLLLVDPDAPSPENPVMAQWLHWLVVNIPGGDVSKGDTVTPYAGPTPPKGVHRYIFMLCEQPDGVRLPTAHIDQRARFDASKWAAEHKLSHPVGAMHFITRAAH